MTTSSGGPGPDLLEAIVAATRHGVAAAERARPRAEVERTAMSRAPQAKAFCRGLVSDDGIRVIAECKRRSPSRGVLRSNFDPAAIALGYQAAGAAAISVLTEPAFFDGELDHLRSVRAAVMLPVLRKDFVVTEYQVLEARAIGADAVLLIVAALDDPDLRRLLGAARTLGLAALVEVHDETELARAVDSGADVIGVNNRNLRTLEVDLDASVSLVAKIPQRVVAVAESGIRTSDDLTMLRGAGYDACLVGESLLTTEDPGAALAVLIRETGCVTRNRQTRQRA